MLDDTHGPRGVSSLTTESSTRCDRHHDGDLLNPQSRGAIIARRMFVQLGKTERMPPCTKAAGLQNSALPSKPIRYPALSGPPSSNAAEQSFDDGGGVNWVERGLDHGSLQLLPIHSAKLAGQRTVRIKRPNPSARRACAITLGSASSAASRSRPSACPSARRVTGRDLRGIEITSSSGKCVNT